MASSRQIAKRRGVGRYKRAGLKGYRPDPRAGGRTRSEAAFARSQVAAGRKVSGSSRRVAAPTADVGGRTAGELASARALAPVFGPSSRSNRVLAAPAMPAPVKVGELKPPMKLPDPLKSVADAISGKLDNPAAQSLMLASGGGALAGAKSALSAGKTTQVGREAARIVKTSSEASDAAKVARAARGAEKAAKRAGGKPRRVAKAGRQADKAERQAARSRIRADRARMSRGERVADRAKSAKTRAQAAAYVRTHQALVGGTGAVGTGAVAAAKRSPTKRAAARTLASHGAKRVVTAPRRVGGNAARAGATPALLPVTGVVPAERKVSNVATLPYQVGRATVEDPLGMAWDSYTGLKDMLRGTPKAVEQLVTNPKGAVKDMARDYSYRYGPLVEGEGKEFRRRMRETGGLTPIALDALIAAPPAGRVAGAAARSGALGKKAERFMKKDRPDLLVEAGTKTERAAAEPQKVSRNAARVAAQRATDRVRSRVTASRGVRGTRQGVDAVAKEAADRGAVTPVFHRSVQQKRAATHKARGRAQMLMEQGRVGAAATRALFNMNRDQRLALKFGLGFGLNNPAQAKRFLRKHVEDIRANRDPETQFGRLDNIPDIERIIEKADKIFTPEYRQHLDTFNAGERKIAEQDPGLIPEQAAQRRVMQQADLLGLKRGEFETPMAFRARVDEARKSEGLSEPGYFKSELSRQRRSGSKAIGGQRHASMPKKYSGKLHQAGIENLDSQLMIRGFNEGIKRKHQWKMVSDVAEKNSLPWSRTKDGQGMTATDAVVHLEKEGIDPSSVTLVNPGLLRRQFNEMVEPGRAGQATDFSDLQAGLKKAVADVQDVTGAPEYSQLRGWYAIPKKVADEINAVNGPGGRAAQQAMAKTSGYLLAYNTGWLAFQTMSTAVQAMMRGVTPADYVAAQIWWHKQKPQMTGKKTGFRRGAANADEIMGSPDFDRLNAYAGVSMGQEFRDVPQMGAKAPQGLVGGMVEAARYFREGQHGQALHSLSPVQAWFRMSQIPENATRRALAYKVLKSEGVKRMNQNVKGIEKAMAHLEAQFKLDPGKQLQAMMRDPRALETMAKDLADFLGDYQAFTHRERTYLKAITPFYSWVRFATKFALFTLPSKHPMATGLVYQLGRMETDDLRDMLGDAMGWALGKLFLGKEIDKNSPFIDIYRGNPLLSSVTEFSDVKDIAGFLPPYAGILIDSMAGKSIFTGKGLMVDGETTERKFTQRGALNEAQILLNGWLSMFTPYRAAQEIEHAGRPATDDSILGFPEYKRYAEGSGSDAWNRGVQTYKDQGGAAGVLYRRGAPFLPQNPDALHSIGQYMNAERAREEQQRKATQSRRPGAPAGTSASDFDSLFKPSSSDFDMLFK